VRFGLLGGVWGAVWLFFDVGSLACRGPCNTAQGLVTGSELGLADF